MAQTAENVFRDFVTDGVPSSGANRPAKAAIRELLTGYETIIDAFTTGGGTIVQGAASLPTLLNYPSLTMAWVLDSDPNLAGIYQKQGASGTGSWVRLLDLPYSFIKATNAGAGTANAIVATTSIPIPSADGGALITVNVTAENTGPATISFNGGGALLIKSNSGNDIVAGGLKVGMILAGYVSGGTFRLLSDQASAAIQAAAEAAQVAAEDAATRAETAAAGVEYPVSYGAPQALTDGQQVQAKDNVGYYGDVIVILATGQSNIANDPAFAWTPPENLFLWNGFAGTGTCFDPCGGSFSGPWRQQN